MTYRVLIPEDIAQEGKDYLVQRGYDLMLNTGASAESLQRNIRDCDALLLRKAILSADILKAAGKLKVIAKHGIGVDNIDLAIAAALGIVITNAPLSNAVTVAEHTLGVILALAKNTLRGDRAVRQGDFGFRNRTLGMDLEGKTLSLIGIGRIGSAVAQKASLGFGMRVLGYDPYVPEDKVIPEITLTRDWQEVFRGGNFISLHLPLTSKTRGLVGQHEFTLMKPTAYLINAARGEIVDERALIAALQERRIAGAGLDVLAEEPPAPNNPLLHMDNVVLTPHNAALTKEATARMALHAAIGIHEVLSGKPPSWPVLIPTLGCAP